MGTMTLRRPLTDLEPPLRIPAAHTDPVQPLDMHPDYVTPARAAEIRRDIELDRPNRPPSLRTGRHEVCTLPGCMLTAESVCYRPPWHCPLKGVRATD